MLCLHQIRTQVCIAAFIPDAGHDSDSVEQAVPPAARQAPPHPRCLQGFQNPQIKLVVDEPGMTQTLVRGQPILSLRQEQPRYEVLAPVADLAELGQIEGVFTLVDIAHGAELAAAVEGGDAAGEELVRDDADPPAVGRRRRKLLLHDLGRHVLDGAAHLDVIDSSRPLVQLPGEAEIDDLEVVVVLPLHEDDVEGFEIKMDVAVPVDEGDSTTDLLVD